MNSGVKSMVAGLMSIATVGCSDASGGDVDARLDHSTSPDAATVLDQAPGDALKPDLDLGSGSPDSTVAKETVTCVFKGSTVKESCQSERGRCEGVGSCTHAVVSYPKHQLTWTSSCGGKHSTTVEGKDETITFDCATTAPVSETVTCLFAGSNTQQTCTSVRGSCQGTSTCSVSVQGKSGGELIWTSITCGGTQKTTLDGKDQSVQFKSCGSTEVSEVVTCVFKGSTTQQQCMVATTSIDPLAKSCKGTTSCSVTLKGKVGLKITWKSTCGASGGYAYTVLDGKNENAEFQCK